MAHIVSETVPVGWPTEGRIRFEEVYLSFNDDPPVLKNVTLEIKPREKVWILLPQRGRIMLLASSNFLFNSTIFDNYD